MIKFKYLTVPDPNLLGFIKSKAEALVSEFTSELGFFREFIVGGTKVRLQLNRYSHTDDWVARVWFETPNPSSVANIAVFIPPPYQVLRTSQSGAIHEIQAFSQSFKRWQSFGLDQPLVTSTLTNSLTNPFWDIAYDGEQFFGSTGIFAPLTAGDIAIYTDEIVARSLKENSFLHERYSGTFKNFDDPALNTPPRAVGSYAFDVRGDGGTNSRQYMSDTGLNKPIYDAGLNVVDADGVTPYVTNYRVSADESGFGTAPDYDVVIQNKVGPVAGDSLIVYQLQFSYAYAGFQLSSFWADKSAIDPALLTINGITVVNRAEYEYVERTPFDPETMPQPVGDGYFNLVSLTNINTVLESVLLGGVNTPPVTLSLTNNDFASSFISNRFCGYVVLTRTKFKSTDLSWRINYANAAAHSANRIVFKDPNKLSQPEIDDIVGGPARNRLLYSILNLEYPI